MAPGGIRSRNRFFLNHSKAVVLNNYLALYPTEHTQAAMDDGRVTMAELFDALSEVDANELASAGRHYASGLLKVEPSELMTVRLPRVLAALFHDANS